MAAAPMVKKLPFKANRSPTDESRLLLEMQIANIPGHRCRANHPIRGPQASAQDSHSRAGDSIEKVNRLMQNGSMRKTGAESQGVAAFWRSDCLCGACGRYS